MASVFSEISFDCVIFLAIGVYVANRASDKITQLTDNVYLCRSGSVMLSPFFSRMSCEASLFCSLSSVMESPCFELAFYSSLGFSHAFSNRGNHMDNNSNNIECTLGLKNFIFCVLVNFTNT